VLKGGIQVKSGEQKHQAQSQTKSPEAPKPSTPEPAKALSATASA